MCFIWKVKFTVAICKWAVGWVAVRKNCKLPGEWGDYWSGNCRVCRTSSAVPAWLVDRGYILFESGNYCLGIAKSQHTCQWIVGGGGGGEGRVGAGLQLWPNWLIYVYGHCAWKVVKPIVFKLAPIASTHSIAIPSPTPYSQCHFRWYRAK